MATVKKPSKTLQSARPPKDAVAMLKADHKKVSGLFEEFEKARVAPGRRRWSRRFAPS